MNRRTCLSCWLVVAACGCAPAAVPRANLEAAERAIANATEDCASHDARAVVYLRTAREELADARLFASRARMDRARSMAMRAEADALLAGAIAHRVEVTTASTRATGGGP